MEGIERLYETALRYVKGRYVPDKGASLVVSIVCGGLSAYRVADAGEVDALVVSRIHPHDHQYGLQRNSDRDRERTLSLVGIGGYRLLDT